MNRYEIHVLETTTHRLIYEVVSKNKESASKRLKRELYKMEPEEKQIVDIRLDDTRNMKIYLVESDVKVKRKRKKQHDDYIGMEYSHVACPSYPNCDEDPMGCRISMGDEVEEYGMRD